MAHNTASIDSAAPPALHSSTAWLARYPLGTEVHFATGDPEHPLATGIIRYYVLAKNRETGELLNGDALLWTDDGMVSVPVAAIRSRVSPPPRRWERRVLWLVVVVGLAWTLWALWHINQGIRVAAAGLLHLYVPVVVEPCPTDRPTVSFCPAILSDPSAPVSPPPTPTIVPTPEPTIAPKGGDV